MMEIAAFVIVGLFGLVAVVVAVRLVWFKKQLARVSRVSIEAKEDLPTVSVCIPARNEAHGLSVCLERVLASDYPKLEIIVLDDQSEDDTSILIKSFAHAGVRFIAGKPLSDGWIGKNHSLDTMAREASGRWILFCDVDTKIETNSIRKVVTSLQYAGAQTLSVMPERRDTKRASALFGHLRYVWNMMFDYPGAVSAAWCIDRRYLLEAHDGFSNVRSDVQPERYFANAEPERALIAWGKHLGIAYEKRWSSQVESSERLLFPSFRRAKYRGVAAIFGLLIMAFAVPMLVIIGVLSNIEMVFILLGFVFGAGTILYAYYLSIVWHRASIVGSVLWAWVVLQELWLLLRSVYRYATRTTTWKGRRLTAQPINDNYLRLSD